MILLLSHTTQPNRRLSKSPSGDDRASVVLKKRLPEVTPNEAALDHQAPHDTAHNFKRYIAARHFVGAPEFIAYLA